MGLCPALDLFQGSIHHGVGFFSKVRLATLAPALSEGGRSWRLMGGHWVGKM